MTRYPTAIVQTLPVVEASQQQLKTVGCSDFSQALKHGSSDLQSWLHQAEREQLAFVALLKQHLEVLRNLLATDGTAPFFNAVRDQRESLENYADDAQKLRSFFTAQVTVFLKARADLAKLGPGLRHVSNAALLGRVETARSILNLSDPTVQIPQLAGLLKPVQEQVQALLQQHVAVVQQTSRRVRENVGNYARSTHSTVIDRLDLTTLTQGIDQVTRAATSAVSIDSAIAPQSDLESLYSTLIQQVDQQATQILEQLSQQPDPEHPVVQVKPIVAVKVARVAAKPVLETAADVEAYLTALRGTLMREIEQEDRVRLE